MPFGHISFEFFELICVPRFLGESFKLSAARARDLVEIQELHKVGTLDSGEPILYARQLGLGPSELCSYLLAGEVRTPTQAAQLVG
jgi:hypothetical protein